MHFAHLCRLTFAFFLICLSAGCTFESTPPPVAEVVDDREIVILVDTKEKATRLLQKARQRNYRLKREDALGGLELEQIVMWIPEGTSGQEAIAELEALEQGVTAGVNHSYRAPVEGGQFIAARVYADQMIGWPETGCRANVSVGMIDASVNTADPGLGRARVIRRSFVAPQTPTNHGTVVANIIAGQMRLNNVRLYAASVVGDHRQSDAAAGADAIVRAVDWMQAEGVRVVNVSLAGPFNKILDRGLQSALDRGMIIVAAAGNAGPGAAPRYPAADDRVIAVTAVDANGEVYTRANRGAHIDFAAPGVDVFVPFGQSGGYLSGTSIAAPFVTAVVSATIQRSGGDDVKNLLSQNAVDLGPSGPDRTYGRGLVNVGDVCS